MGRLENGQVSDFEMSYQLTEWDMDRRALDKKEALLIEDSYPYKIVCKDSKYAIFTSGAYIVGECL